MRTHPLAEFELDADADERAVKRAYAKRLKVTRPDEDAAGFQKLNEAYREALAYIRWRDAQGDKPSAGLPRARAAPKAAEPVADTQSETGSDDRQHDAPDADPGEPPVVIQDPPPSPVADTTRRHRTKDGDAADGEPVLVLDPPPLPAAPERERQAVVVEDADEDDEDDFDNDDDLDGYVDEPFTFSVLEFMTWIHGAGYRPVAFRERLRAQMDQWPLTAKPAIAHAVITHLMETGEVVHPTIFDVLVEELGLYDVATKIVDPVRLLQYREDLPARYEAEIFTQAPAPTLRGKWYQSKIFEVTVLILLCVGGLGAVIGSYMSGSMTGPSPPWYRSSSAKAGDPISINVPFDADQTALRSVQEADKLSGGREIEAMDEAISRLRGRTELSNQRILALALYNKGNTLRKTDRSASEAAYRELQSLFKRRQDYDLALLVTASYVNMGLRDFSEGRLDSAFASYAEVLDVYGEVNEGQIAEQVFKALLGQAEVLIGQGKHEEARFKLDALHSRLSGVKDPVLQAMGEKGKLLRLQLPRPQP